MTNDLQTARYDGLIRRVGGLLGGGSKVTETLSELFPMIDVENLPSELMFLGGWRTKFTTKTVPATVGESSRAGLFNPTGSNLILVLTDVLLDSVTAGIIAYQITANQLSTDNFSGRPRDGRDGVIGNSGGKVGLQSTGNTQQFGRLRVSADITFHHSLNNDIAVLPPGIGFEYGTVSDNQTLNITFFWRERAALDSELNFP